jgi:hypothetical protein
MAQDVMPLNILNGVGAAGALQFGNAEVISSTD